MLSPASRAVIIGLDGASMELLKHFAERGAMPNVAGLLANGVHREMVGVLPTLTPPGWTALTTGAWPGTHEVMDFNIRDVGAPLDHTRWGINTGLCRAEYLWNTAERAGKVPIIVKWEMSWPPTIKTGVQVEGTGPGVSNYAQIAGYHFFTAGRGGIFRGTGGHWDGQQVDPSTLLDMGLVDPVEVRSVGGRGWTNLPPSGREPLEAILTIKPLQRGQPRMLRGKEGEPKTLFALIYAQGGRSYNRLRITRERDGAEKLAELAQGEWSPWILDTFRIDGSEAVGHMRFKLITLSPDGDTLELFVPQIWPIQGYTYPENIGKELLEHVGPFLQNPGRDALGLIDDDTYFELLEYHHQNLADTALYLTSSRHWDLLFLETHAPDYANHFFIGQADPISGAPLPVVERCYRGEELTFASCDRMIGRLRQLMDGQTLFILISDHGGTPSQFQAVDVANVLEKAGLVCFREESGGGRVIDWDYTRALPVGLVNIFINLKGREPNGIVDPLDYEATQREIIAALYEYCDPATGRHPFSLALTRADAEMVNLWGELVGDVVYALRPEFDGAHGRQLPSARLGLGSQHSVFVMAGPGVRRGAHLRRQVRPVDVAPTISYLLGMPLPRDVEGGVIYEALEDPDWPLHALARLRGEKSPD